jgi:hypothetical protein
MASLGPSVMLGKPVNVATDTGAILASELQLSWRPDRVAVR